MLSFLKLCFYGKGRKNMLEAYFNTVYYIKPELNQHPLKESEASFSRETAANIQNSNITSHEAICSLSPLSFSTVQEDKTISKTKSEPIVASCKQTNSDFADYQTSATRPTSLSRPSAKCGDSKVFSMSSSSVLEPDLEQKSDNFTRKTSPALGFEPTIPMKESLKVEEKIERKVDSQDSVSMTPSTYLTPFFPTNTNGGGGDYCTLNCEISSKITQGERNKFGSKVITSMRNEGKAISEAISKPIAIKSNKPASTDSQTSSARFISSSERITEDHGKKFEVRGCPQNSASTLFDSFYSDPQDSSHDCVTQLSTSRTFGYKYLIILEKKMETEKMIVNKNSCQNSVTRQSSPALTPCFPKLDHGGGDNHTQNREELLDKNQEKFGKCRSKFTGLFGKTKTEQPSPLPHAMQDINQYRLLHLLGTGDMFSRVYKVQYLGSKEKFALKVVECPPDYDDVSLNEIYVLKRSNGHSLLLEYYSSYEYRKQDGGIEYGILTKFFKGQTLFEYMSRKPLPRKNVKRILLQLGQVVKYIHSLGIIHCNIKPENILINSRMEIKLIGFGLSQRGPTTTIASGTPCFAAPEVGISKRYYGGPVIYGYPADYYSIGAVFYEMVYAEPPPERIAFLDAMEKVLNFTFGRPPKYGCCGSANTVKKEGAVFMAKLLNFCPEARPNDETFLKDAYFNSTLLTKKRTKKA